MSPAGGGGGAAQRPPRPLGDPTHPPKTTGRQRHPLLLLLLMMVVSLVLPRRGLVRVMCRLPPLHLPTASKTPTATCAREVRTAEGGRQISTGRLH